MKLSIEEASVNMEPYGSVKALSQEPSPCCGPKPLGAKTRRDRRREAILDVAREVFSEEGYDAASMSTIAARLGGSKGTLYNYFRSKAELFEAYIEETCAQHAEDLFGVPLEGSDLRDVLTRVGERLLSLILSDETTRFFSLVVAAAQQSPATGQIFYDSGYRTGIRRLADYFEQARAEGTIVAEDCHRAAEDFLNLCHGIQIKRVLKVIPLPSAEEIHAEAVHMATIFLRAYGAGA